ncbi:MAG: hypothetical protein Q9211_001800 [Gyalolechia sp. 1 TL-2023]
MDEPGTVFYLFPDSDAAVEIVKDDANRERRRVDPDNVSRLFLRIGFDPPSKVPGRLATFGRIPFANDVILNQTWSKSDQCYFNIHPTTGELLLHDVSKRGNTRLHHGKDGIPDQIWKSPRQCVVRLNRNWIFEMGCAIFILVPRETPRDQEKTVFLEEKLAFARQPVPEEYEGTYQGTLERLLALDLQYCAPRTTINPHNTRVTHPNGLKSNEEVRYTQLGPLGKGGQGQVHEVVDMYDGEHYARKIVEFKPIPRWDIQTERDFKKRIQREVDIVKNATHPHIVPYLFHQGWQIGRSIEIFMPVYEKDLRTLLDECRSQGQVAVQNKVESMFIQILLALDHVHTRKPPIIHRDIKPENILSHGDKFLLTDFGIAKVADASRTTVGTLCYMAPELWLNYDQTSKVDMYALGATTLDCLERFPPQAEKLAKWPRWHEWHHNLQKMATRYASIAPLLADGAAQRPTACDLLKRFFPQPFQTQHLQTNDTRSNSGTLAPITNQADGMTIGYSAALTPMDWTQFRSTGIFQKKTAPSTEAGRNQAPKPCQVCKEKTERSRAIYDTRE